MTAVARRDSGLTRAAGPPAGDPDSVRGYRRLWCAVLQENLSMLFGHTSGVQGGLTPAHWRGWHKTSDFELICDLAGLDVDYMRAFVERELRSSNPGVLFSSRYKRERSSEVARRRSGAVA